MHSFQFAYIKMHLSCSGLHLPHYQVFFSCQSLHALSFPLLTTPLSAAALVKLLAHFKCVYIIV